VQTLLKLILPFYGSATFHLKHRIKFVHNQFCCLSCQCY